MPTTDHEMTYTLPHEAWYADAWRIGCDKDATREIVISKAAKGGGCDWEFYVVEIADIGVQVRMYDDAWQSFDEAPELFAGLGGLAPNEGRPGFDDVLALLDRLGYRDATDRNAPDRTSNLGEAHTLRKDADELDKGRVTAMAEVSD